MSGRKVSAAESVVLLLIFEGASAYDAEDLSHAEVARVLDECEAMGWIDDDHELTDAGRETVRL